MACASAAGSAAAGSNDATSWPARSTAMRSDTARTSSSLWLMKRIAMPCATIFFSVANRARDSCGVSTAVGSSRISKRAPRVSAFRISTRWRSPTDSSAMRASGFTCRPKRCAASSSRARASRRRENGCHNGSVPSITLSSTLRLSASVKCWCTMPMPAASAAFGWPGGSGRPSHFDRTGVGDVVPEQDRHQRALAGTVLAEQRQHFAGTQLERHRVVGHHLAEALGDATQAQQCARRSGLRGRWGDCRRGGVQLGSVGQRVTWRLPSAVRRPP